LTVMGCGMMVNTLQAGLKIFNPKPAPFERTPKFGIEKQQDDWKQRQKYHLKLDPIVFVELGLAVWNALTAWLAISMNNWGIAFYAAIFCAGLMFVAGLSIFQSAVIRQRQMAAVSTGD